MAPTDDRKSRPEPKDLRPKAPDQLSPNRALEESLGASSSQRVGNSGPVANPTVSFPGEPAEDDV
jgi:hypothetical protein